MATKGLETEKLVQDLKQSLKKRPAKKDKPKAAAKAKTPAPVTRRAARYAETDIVKLTDLGKKGNPKRGMTTAAKLYEIYLKNPKGISVGDYIKLAGATDRPKAGRTAIAWDVAHKYITVGPK